ncbi:MAG TPA: ethanolamine ammonia-lyase light chain EutC, partial [Roseateles sp.]|nr:ethanolamine ammonia-lyase light chain EutC [Roseateles sp.]
MSKKELSHSDAAWADLRALTRARIALGRSGAAQRTRDVLAFGVDHALA